MKRWVIVVATWLVWMAVAPVCCRAQERAVARQELSLDGKWDIIFDRANRGRAAHWERAKIFDAQPGRRGIDVPSCWERIEKDYEGVAFYRHTFQIPADWAGKVVRLHFDAVNFRAEVWLNDQAVGVHEGGFTPFDFRVGQLVRAGEENTLIVRVAGPILLQNKRIDGVGPMETPQWRGAITGGIWQSVRLVATDAVYLEDVFVEPKLADDSATFHVQLINTAEESKSARVVVAIRSAQRPDDVVATVEETLHAHPGPNRTRCKVHIPDAKYWSPDTPNLYRATVQVVVSDRHPSDELSTRFGLREFTIRNKQYMLNGKPLYLKATFFEGLYPIGLAYPDSREMATREILLAKQAGFNMIRPWRKPPPPMWLDLADELGVLTVGSLAVECMDYPIETASLPGWVENEVRQSVRRDRNRTCVVQWELFNELKRPVLKQLLHPMAMRARQLDPTRLILDESGGWAQGANIYLPYAWEPTKFNDIHDYPGQKINDEVYQKLLLTGSKTHEQMRQMGLGGRLPGRNVVLGLMTFFSELGYGSLPDLVKINKQFAERGNPITPPMIYHRRLANQMRQALNDSGFAGVYPDLQKFCLDQQQIHGTANRRMIEAVRCNPNVAGYCIHALVAGDWIIGAGLLDLFRDPKTYAYEGTKAANQPRIVSIRVRPRNVYAAHGTTLSVTGVNDREAVDGQLRVVVSSADGKVIWKRNSSVRLQPGIASLLSDKLDTTKLEGTYTVNVEVAADDGARITENRYSFDVFTPQQLVVPKTRIAVLDPSNSLKPYLRQVGVPFEEFRASTDDRLVVFVSRTEARSPVQQQRFTELRRFINDGGVAVYLQGGGPRVPWGKAGPASALLPVKVRIKRALGHWIGIPRLVHRHDVFNGLPVDCMMGPAYENVWPQATLQDVRGKVIAASIGFDWFPDYDLSKRHYYGPGDVWWGADIASIRVGQGRCVLSQLRLVENLGQDPVADMILANMIRWVTAAAGE